MPRYAVLATHSTTQPESEAGAASAVLQLFNDDEPAGPPLLVFEGQLPSVVADLEAHSPRWVMDSTAHWYPGLLSAGTVIERVWDLSLCRTILRNSATALATDYVTALRAAPQEQPGVPAHALPPPRVSEHQGLLFAEPKDEAGSLESVLAEFAAQRAAVPDTLPGRRLRLLLAAESAGSLIAAEMGANGVPWDAQVHRTLLESELGPRTPEGTRPPKMEELAAELRTLLKSPTLNPDSQQELLRALHRAGIEASSTRQWELEELKHPVIAPLLRYKKLSRLASANGYAWVDAWITGGRFRPEYVVGGVVTGRWASRGGGALQIPHTIRDAARAEEGHVLVVADAAQLEPRILAVLARDAKLADAARGRDLYQGIADLGFGGDRAHAKIAMLGAMYGATTGESGRLLPQLARTFPAAVALVEAAARTGEAGGAVSSFLGRGSPEPSAEWRRSQRADSAEAQRAADAAARSRGRFTRNFVVQSTAAEWALCWLGELRRGINAARTEGIDLGQMVMFLHDEVMLHVPKEHAQRASDLVETSARAAAELLFGSVPVDFPVGIAIVSSYADAK